MFMYQKVLAIIGIVLCSFSSVYAYSGGSGTEPDPYQIGTVSDWNSLMKTSADWNKYFIMTDDVNLQGISLTPVGNATTYFTGIFDGDGYIIYNAVINGSTNIGLFGRTGTAGRIHNLGVEDVNIIGGNYVGGLVGRHYGAITECYVTGKVTGSGNYTGGVVGANYGKIIDCYSMDLVKGISYIGGLVGSTYAATDVNTCYSTGAVTGSGSYVGGLVGYNYNGDVNASFWDVNTSGKMTSAGGEGKTTEQMQDENTFLTAGWDFNTPVWEICSGTNYPKLAWQELLAGDFVCPDGVDYEDLAYFVQWWLIMDCNLNNDCDGTDIYKDGTINFLDFAMFAENWLKGQW